MVESLSLSLRPTRNLDTLGKEVSSLGGVRRNGKTSSQLVGDGLSRCQSLGPKSEDTDHGETAVLQFLQSLLLVLLRRVAKSEGVVTSFALSDAEVSGLIAGSLFLDDSQTTELKEGHEKEDLQKSKSRDLSEGL